ncbi:hypothetical protein BDR22DRAFT_892073 [Usnea florida]
MDSTYTYAHGPDGYSRRVAMTDRSSRLEWDTAKIAMEKACAIAPYIDLVQSDVAMKRCNQVKPFCGTYAFLRDTPFFNCMATSMPIQNVEFLNGFYMTAIGSPLAPDATTNPSASLLLAISILFQTVVKPGPFLMVKPWYNLYTLSHSHVTAAQPLSLKAFDSYQSVPQHDQHSFQYPGPHQQAKSSYPPLASAVLPPPTGPNDPHFSSATTSIPPYSPGGREQRQGHNIPPLSPMVTEVDGTKGYPGVPKEVDGTMGNSGVPAGRHRIENKLMPSGSPSAAEIGVMVGGGWWDEQARLRQHVASTQHGDMKDPMNQSTIL